MHLFYRCGPSALPPSLPLSLGGIGPRRLLLPNLQVPQTRGLDDLNSISYSSCLLPVSGVASKQGDYVAGLVQRATSLNFLEAEVDTW